MRKLLLVLVAPAAALVALLESLVVTHLVMHQLPGHDNLQILASYFEAFPNYVQRPHVAQGLVAVVVALVVLMAGIAAAVVTGARAGRIGAFLGGWLGSMVGGGLAALGAMVVASLLYLHYNEIKVPPYFTFVSQSLSAGLRWGLLHGWAVGGIAALLTPRRPVTGGVPPAVPSGDSAASRGD